MKLRYRVLWSVLIAMVAGLGALVIAQLEPYEEMVDQGPSPEVRRNPMLAAEHFLRERTIAVQAAKIWSDLPDTRQQRQTLLLLGKRTHMRPAEVEKLLAWTRAGGHLVLVAEQTWNEQTQRSGDLLLDRLQIRRLLTRDLPEIEHEQPAIPLAAPRPPAQRWPELTRLYLENETAPAYLSFDPAFHLEDPEDHARYWANSANATHMLQLVEGEGLVTILTDSQLWQNNAIGRHDNAWLLWYLTQDSHVTLITDTDHDNLLTLLLRHFPQALVALAVLLALGLWRVALREGPVQSPAPLARRQLAEHLRASAGFLLRRRGHQALLKHLQQDILRRARLRHPGFESLSVAEQWQFLARLTRQPTSAIGEALHPPSAQRLSSAEFTRQVAHLQTIRNAL
ncbi:DUF4350 domain-containing protein [Pseudomonas sp. 3A(2025)]